MSLCKSNCISFTKIVWRLMKIISTRQVGNVLIPVVAGVLLVATFGFIEFVTGKEEKRVSVEDSCCLVYLAQNYDGQEEVAASSNVIGWGLSWRKGSTEPVTDPGAAEMLAKYGAVYRGDVTSPEIYLTFDLGYEAGYTAQILDTLKEKNVKAIFFLLKNYVDRNPELVQRMIDEGHTIGNHSMTHKSLPTVDGATLDSEVDGFNTLMENQFGYTTKFFRPPCGEYNESVLSALQQKGYTTLFWSFAYKDWDKNGAKGGDYAYKNIVSKLHNGMVILLHSTTPDNAEALPKVIDSARSQGYSFGIPEKLYNNR